MDRIYLVLSCIRLVRSERGLRRLDEFLIMLLVAPAFSRQLLADDAFASNDGAVFYASEN